jgi:hypothetical protein
MIPKNQLISLSIALLLSTILTACNLTAPANDEIIEMVHTPMYLGGETTNWQVAKKLKCNEISATARADGISEAWLVEYTFEYGDSSSGRQREAAHPAVVIRKDGEWTLFTAAGCP